jgi:hypothetical protein
MTKTKKLLFLLIVTICLFGCSPDENIIFDTESPITRTPAIISPTETISPPLNIATPDESTTAKITESAVTISPLPQYHIEVDFDYGNQIAIINQVITFTNSSDSDLIDILLACDMLRYADAFILTSSSINNIQIDPEIGPFWLKFHMLKPLSPETSLNINLSYTLHLPAIPPAADDKKPGIFGYTALQSNFVDWYPMIVPLDKSGDWLLHDPGFYGEYLVYDLADFEVNIHFTQSASNLVLAASSVPISQSEADYKFIHKKARNFVWSVSLSYLSSQENFDGITVTSYYFPFHQQAGQQVLVETIKAIKLYSALFGDFPRESLSIVEGDFFDGMEFDGFYFLSRGFYNLYDGSPQGYLTMIAVHETAHQWWYTLIANDQAMEPWLDESLCTYSELLFYENQYPELVPWWWEYRVNYYNPTGWVNLPIYDYNGFVPYRDATYLRGAQFLQAIRSRIGDEKFISFIKLYATTFSYKISKQSDFWSLLNSFANQDFSDIQKTFFLNP